MMGILRWIWQQIRHVAGILAGLASSVLTWIAAAVGVLVSWANDLLQGVLSGVWDFVGSPFQNIDIPALHSDIFRYMVGFLALDQLATYIVDLAAIWLACRVARLAMVPIRAALELL